ncbi:50S ribosomal protein L18 [candidate division WWE3 bacterium]|jgi:large subunit ribosomal protein L18|nr:50S ribosomal protein L18 [candidate division WWE3 bacterium]MBT7349527.1 50S ribosomal protein L18 [candidate division WWE3 bacterium]
MSILKSREERRRLRVRKKVMGTSKTPRLTVYRSNKYITAQIIDDLTAKTLVDVQAEAKKLHKGKNKTEAAFEVGKELAKKALEKKISKVVFDRGSFRYHGRVKSFADGARDGGLKF